MPERSSVQPNSQPARKSDILTRVNGYPARYEPSLIIYIIGYGRLHKLLTNSTPERPETVCLNTVNRSSNTGTSQQFNEHAYLYIFINSDEYLHYLQQLVYVRHTYFVRTYRQSSRWIQFTIAQSTTELSTQTTTRLS
jgi:hypothetical protein